MKYKNNTLRKRSFTLAFGHGAAWLCLCMFLWVACKPKATGDAEEKKENAITPVKISTPQKGSLSDFIQLNATSSFLKKEFVKSTANGYVSEIKVAVGDKVKKGQILFVIQTKEARALANYKSAFDSLHFKGLIPVVSNREGIVSAISHQKEDYVQDAEQLAIIAETNSLVFLIDAPYQYHKYLFKNKACSIELPDGEKIAGHIETDLPVMDVTNQTQNYVVRPASQNRIPEGLIARVSILKTEKTSAVTLPKGAVLSDEKEENFWIMKLINDSTAVKVSVKIGMQNDSSQEILSPVLDPADRIIVSGSYGLGDTAKVKIIK